MLTANVLLATIVMIYEFVQHGRSTHFDPRYIPTSGSYDKGLFDLETWICNTSRFFPSLREYKLGIQCAGEKTSRCLLVVVCVSSLAMLGNFIWDIETTQVVFTKKVLNKAELGEDG